MENADDASGEIGETISARARRGFEDIQSSFTDQTAHIGQILLQRGDVSDQQFSDAVGRQSVSGCRVGEELVGNGDIRAFDLYRALAAQRGVPFVNLLLSPPDPNLLDVEDLGFYLRHQCLPWKSAATTPTYVAVNLEAAATALREKTGQPFLLYQTAPLDILRTVQSAFSADLTEGARSSLLRQTPTASACQLLSPRKRAFFTLVCGLSVAAFVFFPGHSLLALNIATVVAFMALALLRLLSVRFARTTTEASRSTSEKIPDRDLPLYTIMVPLLREAEVLPILMDALGALDYPGIRYQPHLESSVH
jgi:glycosyltransferase XagB